MKAVHLLVDSKLPEDLRDPSRKYDTKSVSALMTAVAQRYPDRYDEISKAISDIGRNASYRQLSTLCTTAKK